MERDHRVASGARADPFSRSGTYRGIIGFHSSGCDRRWRAGACRRWRRRRQRIRLTRRAPAIRAGEIRSDGHAKGHCSNGSTGEAAGTEAARRVSRDARATGTDCAGDDSDNRRRNRECGNGWCRSWERWWGRVGRRSGSRERTRTRHRRRTGEGLSPHRERLVHTADASAISGEGVSHESVLRRRRARELPASRLQSHARRRLQQARCRCSQINALQAGRPRGRDAQTRYR